MRKILIPLALFAALAVSAVAYAQQQQNQYTVSLSTTSTAKGTLSRPVPIGSTFAFNVQSVDPALRPAGLKRLSVRFNGIHFNTRRFRSCTAAQIQRSTPPPGGTLDSSCPTAARVATGFAKNVLGNKNDPTIATGRAVPCNLRLRLYNGGATGAALVVFGQPNDPNPAQRCITRIDRVIPVSITRSGANSTLSFTIPDNLTEPAPGVSNSLFETSLKVARKTTRYRGRTVGFLEAVGGCVRNQRRATATFNNVNGTSGSAQGVAPCR